MTTQQAASTAHGTARPLTGMGTGTAAAHGQIRS
jgi:hypothetical protein